MEEKSAAARDRIMCAYRELMKSLPYNHIPVTRIISKAGVTRSTFYRNFADVYDLYEAVCRDCAEAVIKEAADAIGTDWSDVDIPSYIDLFEQVLERHYEELTLLSGKTGSLRFITVLRECILKYSENSASEAIAGFFGDSSITGMLIDSIFLYGFLSVSKEKASKYSFRGILARLNTKKQLIENVGEDMQNLSADSGFFDYRLLKAAYKLWCNKKNVALSVDELTRQAGIPRTEFYLHYKNIVDFYSSFEKAAACTISKFAFILCFSDKSEIGTRLLDNEEHFDEHINLVKNIPHTALFTFIFNTALSGNEAFFDFLGRNLPADFIAEYKNEIIFYYSLMFCCAWQYLVTGNTEKFKKDLAMIYDFSDNYFSKRNISLEEYKQRVKRW